MLAAIKSLDIYGFDFITNVNGKKKERRKKKRKLELNERDDRPNG